jgi:hypothetical protein
MVSGHRGTEEAYLANTGSEADYANVAVVICQIGLPLCHERFAIGPSRDQEGLLGAAP